MSSDKNAAVDRLYLAWQHAEKRYRDMLQA
jgi:hypothetical protein